MEMARFGAQSLRYRKAALEILCTGRLPSTLPEAGDDGGSRPEALPLVKAGSSLRSSGSSSGRGGIAVSRRGMADKTASTDNELLSKEAEASLVALRACLSTSGSRLSSAVQDKLDEMLEHERTKTRAKSQKRTRSRKVFNE